MKDIKKIQEFFSKPLKENAMSKFTDYSNNELVAYARELSKQRADAASKGQSDLLGGINKEIETATRELKKRSQALKNLTRTDVNEQEQDPIDIITMDVPLFIRILEYSREDAQEDMDLHELAQKAIEATKQQGILQMDDYDMLVGELEQLTEGIDEEELFDIILRYVKDSDDAEKELARYQQMGYKGFSDSLKANLDRDMDFVSLVQQDHDKETLRRERGLEEKIREVIETIKLGQQLNEDLCDKGKRYIAARKRAGEKSSAYLSGRAVKVCKGQIEWPKKGKKKK